MTAEIWFPEPELHDPTWAKRGEQPVDWLRRSTLPRARESRRFLNHNISMLPDQVRERVVRELGCQWRSAFFEMVVFRILQELGASLEIEPQTPAGKRPDVRAVLTDGAVTVEATAPVCNASTWQAAKKHAPLLDIIQARVPEGWWAMTWELPELDLSSSRKEFVRAVDRIMSNLPDLAHGESIDVHEFTGAGPIRIEMRRTETHAGGLGIEPILSGWDDSETRIRSALHKKRRQVRGAGSPVLLAIDIGELSGGFEAFNHALYGRTFERVGLHGGVIAHGFTPDGVFNNRGEQPPTYAGVLAFTGVGFRAFTPPRLYHHPRSTQRLPDAFSTLQQVCFDKASMQVRLTPGTDAYEALQFVPDDI